MSIELFSSSRRPAETTQAPLSKITVEKKQVALEGKKQSAPQQRQAMAAKHTSDVLQQKPIEYPKRHSSPQIPYFTLFRQKATVPVPLEFLEEEDIPSEIPGGGEGRNPESEVPSSGFHVHLHQTRAKRQRSSNIFFYSILC